MKIIKKLLIITTIMPAVMLGGCSFWSKTNNVNDFGIKLLKQKESKSDNIIVSPAGTYLALGMIYNGSVDDTQKSFESVMNLGGSKDKNLTQFVNLNKSIKSGKGGNTLDIGNSLWINQSYSLNQDLISKNDKFDGETQNKIGLDTINSRAKDATDGKIEGILDALENDKMALVSAIYFKGDLSQPFLRKSTKKGTFTSGNGVSSTAYMMNQSGKYKYYEDSEVQLAELPYAGNGMSLVVFFTPTEDISSFVAGLTDSKMENYFKGMKSRAGTISLPKFNIAYSSNFQSDLTNLGLGKLFEQFGPNFSDISDSSSKDIYLSKAVQKIYIEMPKDIISSNTDDEFSQSDNPFQINLNKPFLMVIKENRSDNIMFLGEINNISSN